MSCDCQLIIKENDDDDDDEHDGVSNQTVAGGLTDLPRPNGLSMAQVVTLTCQPADT